MSSWSAWPAPAKLNLFLHIVGRRADGYHELQTIFQLLDWGDTVHLRRRSDGMLTRCTSMDAIPIEHDLCLRAAQLLKPFAPPGAGVDIRLDKKTPIGGGLGGGSSDAATVLTVLNQQWGCRLDLAALASLALELGADVPVFVRGQSAWGEGIGEQLTPIDLPGRWYVVVDTHTAVPTGPLFQAPELTRDAAPLTIPRFLAGELGSNAFEPVVRARYPRVDAAFDWLGQFGRARLSGSGGCVFLDAATRDDALAIADHCPQDMTAHVAQGVNQSPLQYALKVFAAGASPSW